MVGLTRFELVTSSMSTRHSNQLSYNPIFRRSCPNDKMDYNKGLKICQGNFSKE